MKRKATVKHITGFGRHEFLVYGTQPKVIGESLLKIFSYKPEVDQNDIIWGKQSNRDMAIEFAKKWEAFVEDTETEEVIYKTPE